MKKLKFYYILLIALAGLLRPLQYFGQSTTILKGSLKNAQKEFFLLRQQGRADTIKIGPDGVFDLHIEQNSGNYFTIEHAKQAVNLFLLPADEITIELNATSLGDVKEITGKSAPYCRYLFAKQKADKGLQNQFPSYRIGSLPGDKYFAIRDSIKTARNNFLASSTVEGKFISSFSNIEKKSFEYQMGLELINFKNQASKMGMTMFPAQFDEYNKKLNLNEEDLSYDFYFRSFALNQLGQIAATEYYAGTDKSVLHYYELEVQAICNNITSEKNKSILISELMPQMMNDVGTSDMSKIIATMESCSSDKKLIASVKKAALQYDYLRVGKPSPDVAFYDASGVKSRISDYKGKVLYIDTWATWCGPCKKEIPFLKTLEEEFHGKNVQFISVSTDKDINAWKNFIAKEQMGGLQLHQSDNFDETISKMFIVNSIPRFIIIDEAGNIVNTDAPRPSSGEQIRNLLSTLLAD